MNFSGVILGIVTFAAIGVGFLWVIKLEYYIGAHIWKWVALFGILVSISSLFIDGQWLSAIVGIFGGTIVWGAFELPDQEKRVAKGMFKVNPKRKLERNS